MSNFPEDVCNIIHEYYSIYILLDWVPRNLAPLYKACNIIPYIQNNKDLEEAKTACDNCELQYKLDPCSDAVNWKIIEAEYSRDPNSTNLSWHYISGYMPNIVEIEYKKNPDSNKLS